MEERACFGKERDFFAGGGQEACKGKREEVLQGEDVQRERGETGTAGDEERQAD